MSYILKNQKSPNSSTRKHFGHDGPPIGIVIHHWGVTGQKHENVANYLCRTGGDSSAHDVISAGKVTHLVDFDRAAWHAGNREANGAWIGLECRPEMSKGDWDTLVQRCADIEEMYGSMKYSLHKDWKATACPGKYSKRLGELIDAINAEHARRKNDAVKPSKPAKPTKPKPSKPKPYTGPSLVDYLVSVGKPATFAERRKIALRAGITGYTGTAKQNTWILSQLRSGALK